MLNAKDIYSFIEQEENKYKTESVKLTEEWDWSMEEHIRRSFLYKNSQTLSGKDDETPVRNIILPITRLQYRLEGFDVKDVFLYLTNPELFFKSAIMRKYHETWAIEKNINGAIDSSVESYVDYGGALMKRVSGVTPDVVPLESLCFADQNNILASPLGIRHEFSISQLYEQKGWGDKKYGADITIDELVILLQGGQYETKNKIVVYEVRGSMPNSWLTSGEGYSNQLQIIVPCTKKGSKDKSYFTLFKSKSGDDLKFLARDPIHNRALGLGGIEELFEPQMWTNYSEKRQFEMLEEASKIIYRTTDKKFGQRESLRRSKTGQVYYVDGELAQIDNFPRNQAQFEKVVDRWQVHAQGLGDAHNALRGESPSSGTPAALQELVVQQGQGQHDYRAGKIQDFWGGIYDDWIIPGLSKELSTEKEFFAELSLKEIRNVARNLAQKELNRKIIRRALDKKGIMSQEEMDQFKASFETSFAQGGNQRFLKILQDEFKGEKLGVKFNIAGRQAQVAKNTRDLLAIINQVVSSGGAILQNEGMADLFNQVIEFSGLNPVDFTSFAQPQQPTQKTPLPEEELAPVA